jgi:hypothetical protein
VKFYAERKSVISLRNSVLSSAFVCDRVDRVRAVVLEDSKTPPPAIRFNTLGMDDSQERLDDRDQRLDLRHWE